MSGYFLAHFEIPESTPVVACFSATEQDTEVAHFTAEVNQAEVVFKSNS